MWIWKAGTQAPPKRERGKERKGTLAAKRTEAIARVGLQCTHEAHLGLSSRSLRIWLHHDVCCEWAPFNTVLRL